MDQSCKGAIRSVVILQRFRITSRRSNCHLKLCCVTVWNCPDVAPGPDSSLRIRPEFNRTFWMRPMCSRHVCGVYCVQTVSCSWLRQPIFRATWNLSNTEYLSSKFLRTCHYFVVICSSTDAPWILSEPRYNQIGLCHDPSTGEQSNYKVIDFLPHMNWDLWGSACSPIVC